jgi:hypothetical protein
MSHSPLPELPLLRRQGQTRRLLILVAKGDHWGRIGALPLAGKGGGEWRGLAPVELALRAGLHRVQLHDIETGKSQGPVDTPRAIAVALGVAMDDVAKSWMSM